MEDTVQVAKDARFGRSWLIGCALVALGLGVGGWAMGDGLVRMKHADRAVTVRGLAERDVTADLATWTLAYSARGSDLATAQADINGDTAAIRAFFKDLGFPDDALQPTGASVQQSNEYGQNVFVIRQRLSLRSNDIARARRAVARQFALVEKGVVLDEGSGMAYSFTKLDSVKPAMVAAATADARKAAEQFAKDSGTGVGGIKSATQGYFSVESRDGDSGGWGVSDTPYKKVRVVTTIDFYLQ